MSKLNIRYSGRTVDYDYYRGIVKDAAYSDTYQACADMVADLIKNENLEPQVALDVITGMLGQDLAETEFGDCWAEVLEKRYMQTLERLKEIPHLLIGDQVPNLESIVKTLASIEKEWRIYVNDIESLAIRNSLLSVPSGGQENAEQRKTFLIYQNPAHGCVNPLEIKTVSTEDELRDWMEEHHSYNEGIYDICYIDITEEFNKISR